MIRKTTKNRKQKTWLSVLVLSVAVLAVSAGIYFYQKAHDRQGLSAEETMAVFMECWRKHDYDPMVDMIYPPYRKQCYGGDQAIISVFKNQEVTGVVGMERDPSQERDQYDAYDQTVLHVTYLSPTIGGSLEPTDFYYDLIQPEKNGVWYIGDGGPGP